MTTQSPLLSYHYPAGGFRPGRFAVDFAAILGIFISLYWMTGFIVIFVLPKVRELYKDYKLTLPAATRMVFAFSSWFSDDWGWLLLFLLPLALAAYFAWRSNGMDPPRLRWRFLLRKIVILVSLVALLYFLATLALTMPLIRAA
jgi:type II secretory pathway component PulF